MGAFSDFCKGYCITGTGALALRVAVSRRDEAVVSLYDATRNEKKQFSINALKFKKEDKWANYIKGVLSLLISDGHRIPCGLNITLKGALLYCDELTLSSALSIGLINALNELFSFKLDKNSIIRISHQALNQYSNIHPRVRDLITMLYAEEGKVIYFDLTSMNYRLIDYNFSDFDKNEACGIIVDPQIPPQILRNDIEETRQDAHDCCVNLAKCITDGTPIRDISIRELKSHVITGITEHERRTSEHVILESIKVQRGVSNLERGYAQGFGRALSDVYISMRDTFNIVCPEVDWLMKRAGEIREVYGGSLVSNGALGSIYLILTKSALEEYTQKFSDYEMIFGFKPEMRTFIPHGPATVVKVEQ
ncbi:MAG: hypothetical protein K6G51_01640 [Sphaerochaetaceae bacterium]|nr:hypothetical protein [Sphaerochaetaceae bacterium]